MPRSFAPAIPLGGLALAVVIAAGVGIAAAPSSDDTRDAAVVMRHHDHDRMKVRKELRKEMRKEMREHRKGRALPGRGPRGDGPPGQFMREFGGRGFSEKQLDRSPAFALLPDDLQQDVRSLVSADPDERPALMESIRTKALAGEYGPKVEAAVRLLEEHRRDAR